AGDVFTVITIVTAIIWVVLACLAGWRLRVESQGYYAGREGKKEAVVAPEPGKEGAAKAAPAPEKDAEKKEAPDKQPDSETILKGEVEATTPGKSTEKKSNETATPKSEYSD